MTPEEIAFEMYKIYAERNKTGTELPSGKLFQLWQNVANSLSLEERKRLNSRIEHWKDQAPAERAARAERVWQESIDKLAEYRDEESRQRAINALKLLIADFQLLSLRQACLAADKIQEGY